MVKPANYVDLFVQKMRDWGSKRLSGHVFGSVGHGKGRKKAPEIKTGYVIPIQFGRFEKDSVDFFAIEDFSYQEDLVTQAHEMKKTLSGPSITSRSWPSICNNLLMAITDELTEAQRLKKDLKQNKSYFDPSWISSLRLRKNKTGYA